MLGTRYGIFRARLNPSRGKVPGIHSKQFHPSDRWAIRDGNLITPFESISDAIVYHGVGTDFRGDVIRLEWSPRVRPAGEIECLGWLEPPREAGLQSTLAPDWMRVLTCAT